MSASPAPRPNPAGLSAEQSGLLDTLTRQLDGAGLWWLSGYAAGLAQTRSGTGPTVADEATSAPSAQRLTIVYGTQTGNAKRLAEGLASRLGSAGLPVRTLRADAYNTRELKHEHYLVVVISTQGDGDPPDDARGFVDFLMGKRAPQLPELHFAVLGLGDSSYPQFCEIGRRIDARLESLGATRWFARADADLDIEHVAGPWLDTAVTSAESALATVPPSATVTPLHRSPAVASTYSRDKPFPAELLVNQRITGRGSARDVRHLELSLAGSGLHYRPGDALGVWPVNPPALVDAVLDVLGLDAGQVVSDGRAAHPLRVWLSNHRELTRLNRRFVAAHAERGSDAGLAGLLEPAGKDALAALIEGHQLIDLLRTHPADWTADALVGVLRPLAPRLYSIASSQQVVGEEAHLTLAHVEYRHGEELRWGAASNFLARAREGELLPIFIEPNERFRVPEAGDRDLIMIGAGTGVAPFRGFIQERVARGATGRHWLVFGNPRARTDFLYQVEWQDALARGELHRLDLAFSRDQVPSLEPTSQSVRKTYVQHRLLEAGRELHTWLEAGAHLYVCGASAMAKDVHAALQSVLVEHGGKTPEQAEDHLNALLVQGRYARDIY